MTLAIIIIVLGLLVTYSLAKAAGDSDTKRHYK